MTAIADPAVAMALDDIRRILSAMDARIAAMEKSRAHPLPQVEIIEHPAGYDRRIAGHSADYLPSDVALPGDGCPLCGLPKDGSLLR
jgi:hypothetical protein